MTFVICCVMKEGSGTPIKDWFGCRIDVDVTLSTLYHEFCDGKFDDQPVEDAQWHAFATVKIGSSRSCTKDFTKVSSSSFVTDMTKTLGPFHAAKKMARKTRDELETHLDTFLYSCGRMLWNEEDEERSDLMHVYVRANLDCQSQIEFTYYSAGFEDICIHCGTID